MLGWSVLAAIAILTGPAQCDIASVTDLRNLVYVERSLVGAMYNYLYVMENKLAYIKTYIDEFSRVIGFAEEDGSDHGMKIVSNPLQAFQMLRRLTEDWTDMKTIMADKEWPKVLEAVEQSALPTEEDVKEAVNSLVRLQDTYKLTLSDMARGLILGLQTTVGLTARDCFYMGQHLLQQAQYGHAVRWLEEALYQSYLEGSAIISSTEILSQLIPAAQMHDMAFEDTRNSDGQWLQTLDHPIYSKDRLIESAPEELIQVPIHWNMNELENMKLYKLLCSGKKFRVPQQETRLRCRYTRGRHPYLLLQPIMLEEHSLEPYVVQLYGVVSDKEAATLLRTAIPKLARSQIQNNVGNAQQSSSRVSKNSWISSDDDPQVAKVSRRIQMITGLSTDDNQKHLELIQVVNYGMAGHYEPHHDYIYADLTPEQMKLMNTTGLEYGERIATLMLYLTDVDLGGATVFPFVGFGVHPVKGSALFWYNVKRSGKPIPLTFHGACPVVYGEKWIAAYWFRGNGQMFRRPCSLNPNL